MIMANFCQTVGNAAQGGDQTQMHRHRHGHILIQTHTYPTSFHAHAYKTMQRVRQLLIELT